jgi:hypothetical protein
MSALPSFGGFFWERVQDVLGNWMRKNSVAREDNDAVNDHE